MSKVRAFDARPALGGDRQDVMERQPYFSTFLLIILGSEDSSFGQSCQMSGWSSYKEMVSRGITDISGCLN